MLPSPQTRQSPHLAGSGNNMCLGGRVDSSSNTDPIEILLGRLDKVRRCGSGHIARCPSHEDRSASLSINSGTDGRVLLNCFAGCSAADVVASLGLQIADLFVRKPTATMSFAERSALREHGRQSQWRAALNVIDLEATVVQIAARQMLTKQPLDESDYQRLVVASNRITNSRTILNAR